MKTKVGPLGYEVACFYEGRLFRHIRLRMLSCLFGISILLPTYRLSICQLFFDVFCKLIDE